MDNQEFYIDLGKKLRARRKAKQITLSEMASTLGKSVATISKYEKGELLISIDTLIKICRILSINISDILPTTVSNNTEEFLRYEKYFQDELYVYWFNGEKKKVGTAVIKNDRNSLKSTLFFSVKDMDNIYNCEYVYNGTIVFNDTCTVYAYKNIDPPFDTLMIRIPSLHKKTSDTIGLMTTISRYYQSIAMKALISEHPIHDISTIIPKLMITTEEIKEAKKSNFFTIW